MKTTKKSLAMLQEAAKTRELTSEELKKARVIVVFESEEVLETLRETARNRTLTRGEMQLGRIAASVMSECIHRQAVRSSLREQRSEIARLCQRGYSRDEAMAEVIREERESLLARGFGGPITRCRIGCVNRSY